MLRKIIGETLVVALMSEIKTRKRIKDSIGVQSETLAYDLTAKLRFVFQCHPFCVTSVIKIIWNVNPFVLNLILFLQFCKSISNPVQDDNPDNFQARHDRDKTDQAVHQ